MNRTVTRIAPIPAAKVFAVVYFVMGIVFLPFYLVPVLASDEETGIALYFALALPIVYALAGFVGTAVICSLYNFVAGRIGGIQIQVETQSA